ncbi:MAG: hypothetical protein A3J74_00710, partial [Elusimicrobia bacterium RIFCSPHIGHO2_02_FULL_57_9]
SEAVPFCKTGGLADVVGALSQKLGAAGHDVCLFLPKYRAVEAAALRGGVAYQLSIPLGAQKITAFLRYMQWKSVSICFIDYPPFFDREGLYGREGEDHPDNDQRFILFSRGVLEGTKAIGFKPQIVHAHDWQTALIPAYLKKQYASDPFFARTPSVLTLHNMAYQGNFSAQTLSAAGFGPGDFTSEGVEYFGKFSFLKAGIVYADFLTTVSPAYAREIAQSEKRGFGMEGLLRKRQSVLFGILNGIDTDAWNPEHDANLPRRFSSRDISGKAACKKAVQEQCRLPQKADIPLIAVISRLDYQKGLDIAICALEPRIDRCQAVVLGTGDGALQESFAALARRHPKAVYFHSGFSEALAHRLYAASDIFLMPSRFEPCGLGQMIAMRYGSLPVASKTGGLADTVMESGKDGFIPNGFLAEPGDAEDLGRALDR